jgi:Ca2+-binding EF-hand superfamily protein
MPRHAAFSRKSVWNLLDEAKEQCPRVPRRDTSQNQKSSFFVTGRDSVNSSRCISHVRYIRFTDSVAPLFNMTVISFCWCHLSLRVSSCNHHALISRANMQYSLRYGVAFILISCDREAARRFWNAGASLGATPAYIEGDEDDPERPLVLQRIYSVRSSSLGKMPEQYDVFQLHVQENNMQLARFDFLQLTSYYEGLQVGPSNPGIPQSGATACQMMFKYYAARRQAKEGGGTMTFQEIEEANNSIDMSELNKFMREMLPGIFNRKEIYWMFRTANLFEHGLSDDSVFTMDFEEFVGVLAVVAMQLYRGFTPREMASKLAEKLELHDPLAMRAKLKKMGRIDAGFGAWKSDEGSMPKRFDPKARFRLEADAEKFTLSFSAFCELKEHLLNDFPDVKIPEWMAFPGPFIAFVFPVAGVRNGKLIRFKVTIRNIAPRSIDLYGRLVDLPNCSMTEQAGKSQIAPGMDMDFEIVVEKVAPNCQVGGLVISAEHSGPEIFRCPIFLRSTTANSNMVSDTICKAIAQDVDVTELRSKFKEQDHAKSGRVSVDIFEKVIEQSGFDLDENQKEKLQARVDFEKDETSSSLLVDYDDFVNTIAQISPKVPQPESTALLPPLQYRRHSLNDPLPKKQKKQIPIPLRRIDPMEVHFFLQIVMAKYVHERTHARKQDTHTTHTHTAQVILTNWGFPIRGPA